MPPVHVADAMDTVMEVGFIRLNIPVFCWKAMRCLKIGPERKLAAAQAVLCHYTKEMIMERRKTGHIIDTGKQATADSSVDVLSKYVNDPEYSEDLLQATLITYLIAGRDTIGTAMPWIFYNLAENPHVVSSIRNELAPIVSRKAVNSSATLIFEPEEVRALVYLQATLLESLRLYPPIPVERKAVVASDVMPSGHEVCAEDIIIVSLYSMGRMKDVWGEDCQEYRPERWLSEDGSQLRYVPSHKFLAFNSGPRMCLGKDIAIIQMKTIVAAIV
jgi:cytochrome P450